MNPSIAGWSLAACLALGLGAVHAAPAELQTAAIELRELPREFRLDGVVEATNRTTVSAQTSGQVQQILFDVDDYVAKDAVIVILNDTEHRASVVRAAADLKEAVARRQEARDEYDRIKEVHAKKLVADAALDRAEAGLKSAMARFEAAEAGLVQAREQLRYTRVRAPYAGIVTERHTQIGETAQPGQPLVSGISLEELRVLVHVPQSLVPQIRQHRQARVQLADDGWVDAGRLTVFPFADPGSNTFKVRLSLPQASAGTFPGMFVKTAFVTGVKQELLVPSQAVVYRSEVTAVYVVRGDGHVGFRHVRLGRETDDGFRLVLAGVDQGEQVALDPIAAAVALKRQRAGKSDE